MINQSYVEHDDPNLGQSYVEYDDPPLTYSNQVTYIYYNHIFNKPRLQSSVTQFGSESQS